MLDFNKLLKLMVEHGASDVYLTEEASPMFRINGTIRKIDTKKLNARETEEIAMQLMSPKQKRDYEQTREMNLPLSIPDLGRFRVNIFQQRGAIGIVIRQIKSQMLSFRDLGLPNVLSDLILLKRGLILVVGATGSGKSTTLASMIDYRNTHSAGHIITVEDPIEFVHEHKKSIVTQREVGIDTESFKIALKNSLRQAPDVILIGEIRDTETMDAAITFSETGHLVLATLHSNNANQAMERIMNFFPDERHKQIYLQLSLNLKAIISQRLVVSQDGGRIPAVEVLLDSPRVKDLIQKGKIHELKDAMESGISQGMMSFDQSLYELYQAGRISLEEALNNADSQHNLSLRVKLDLEKEGLKKPEKINRLVSLALTTEDLRKESSGIKIAEDFDK